MQFFLPVVHVLSQAYNGHSPNISLYLLQLIQSVRVLNKTRPGKAILDAIFNNLMLAIENWQSFFAVKIFPDAYTL